MLEANTKFKMKTVVVGAGPVGSLAALNAAIRGDDVEVYELRSDLRDPSTTPLNFTRSINLALSERGINAMRCLQHPTLLNNVLEETIPMRGRMIHGRDSRGDFSSEPQAYDVHGRCIHAIDRAGLNKRLLDELEKMPNVKLFFEHKITGADFKRNVAWFEQRDSKNKISSQTRPDEIEVHFDFMIGADGAHSAVRYHMMKYARVNYHQEYIDTLWCEFRIPALHTEQSDDFRLPPNYLHIWPGDEFMFIAIPSLDRSFTCTLFMPERTFQQLQESPAELEQFFVTKFPGVVPDLISPDALHDQFHSNPHLPLISIKCSPYHYGSSCVIVGDAAHAMVPFYGQGMNAGLEDVRVLFQTLNRYRAQDGEDPKTHSENRAKALEEYTQHRTVDGHTINDLALRNYIEMRSLVRSPLYRTRKWLEERIGVWFPILGWSTQYSRVSFSNERYSEIEKAVAWQGRVLGSAMILLSLGMTAGGVRLGLRMLQASKHRS
ncbi:MAG: kynurenine 3-monooxygenase, mitochondrial precursor [Watsoniomyces obsoletus]|nr:MAG: kynurenine 3-monooxygenase, mitochondrial precursor [Watsoniomyces obsoletus]